jgi:predicted Zn finger-like uncharacterized protein
MSLITRCPACGTMFKVVPDQLRISEGWVRCGHCSEVFDAAASLQRDDDSEPQLPPQEEPIAAPASIGKSAYFESGPESEAEPFGSSPDTEVGESVLPEPPDSVLIEAEAKALKEDPLDRPFELRRADTVSVESPSREEVAPETEPEPDVHDLSFVRQARRKVFWTHTATRIGLGLLFLVLGAGLAAQVALYDRDRLAIVEPGLKPVLAKLCDVLKCKIGQPRQIDAIAIESSSFNKLRGEAYRLNVTLKNQATIQIAMPALELTLTDSQDQAVVRRILMPPELGANSGAIAAGAEWSGSLALAVATNGLAGRVAGYRLLAFYP